MAKVNAFGCDGPSCDVVAPKVEGMRAPSGWIEARAVIIWNSTTKRGRDRVFHREGCFIEWVDVNFGPPEMAEPEDPTE